MTSAGVAVILLQLAGANASGTVTYTAGDDAFIDVGRNNGLIAGAQVKVIRRKKVIGNCEIVEASASNARCRSDKLRPGDRISFEVVPDAQPRAKPAPPREPVPDEVDLAEMREQVLLDAPVPHVKHTKTVAAGVAFSARAQATLREEVWAISSTQDGMFARSTIDGGAHAELDVSPYVPDTNLIFETTMRITGDLIAPPNKQVLNFYVWTMSFAANAWGGGLLGEVGRFRPRMAPGVTLVDGLQLGTRIMDGVVEIGGYAGAVPELSTTVIGLDRLTVGAYGGADINPVPGLMVLPRGRLALISTGDLALMRGELEAQTQVVVRNVATVGTALKTSAGADGAGGASLSVDGARVDGEVTIIKELRAGAGYRYFGAPPLDFDTVAGAGAGAGTGAVLPPVGGAHHAQASARYTFGAGTFWDETAGMGAGDEMLDINAGTESNGGLGPGGVSLGGILAGAVTIGALGGVGYDVASESTRAYVGPEVGLHRAFGSWGGLDVGFLEELGGPNSGPNGPEGAIGGRSAWVTGNFTPTTILQGLRVLARVSYLDMNALGDSYREVGLMTIADAPVLPAVPWLSARARLYLQQSLPSFDGAARNAPQLMMADVSIRGVL